VLDFWQACALAQQQGRGTSASAPVTFSEALTTYQKDLEAKARRAEIEEMQASRC
jgi:hypothetical protein